MSLTEDIILSILIVVTDSFALDIFRTDFGNLFLDIRAVIVRARRVVINIDFIALDVKIVIEAPMELNHSFLGLAGLEYSRQLRT